MFLEVPSSDGIALKVFDQTPAFGRRAWQSYVCADRTTTPKEFTAIIRRLLENGKIARLLVGQRPGRPNKYFVFHRLNANNEEIQSCIRAIDYGHRLLDPTALRMAGEDYARSNIL